MTKMYNPYASSKRFLIVVVAVVVIKFMFKLAYMLKLNSFSKEKTKGFLSKKDRNADE